MMMPFQRLIRAKRAGAVERAKVASWASDEDIVSGAVEGHLNARQGRLRGINEVMITVLKTQACHQPGFALRRLVRAKRAVSRGEGFDVSA